MNCVNCRSELADVAVFCPHCGAKVHRDIPDTPIEANFVSEDVGAEVFPVAEMPIPTEENSVVETVGLTEEVFVAEPISEEVNSFVESTNAAEEPTVETMAEVPVVMAEEGPIEITETTEDTFVVALEEVPVTIMEEPIPMLTPEPIPEAPIYAPPVVPTARVVAPFGETVYPAQAPKQEMPSTFATEPASTPSPGISANPSQIPTPPTVAPSTPPQVAQAKPTVLRIPESFKPMTAPGVFFTLLLLAIPIIGFVFAIVFSVSAKKQGKKSLARAILAYRLIFWALLSIAVIIIFFADRTLFDRLFDAESWKMMGDAIDYVFFR